MIQHLGARVAAVAACAAMACGMLSCAPPADEGADGEQNVVELRRLPVDTMSSVLTRADAQFDPSMSSDGNGSLKIETDEPTVVRLYEMGPIDIEDARLIYQARVRTSDVKGRVYLEMWCHFPEKGAFHSRGIDTALTGTTRWTTQRTAFLLEEGQRPENVRLNLVVDGTGTAWIDDIRLLRAPREGAAPAGETASPD